MKLYYLTSSSRPVVSLPRLRVRGQFFEQENGAHWTAIQCSDFHLFGRFLNSEDITPILQQRADIGFNLLRVWTRYQLAQFGIGDCTLAMHPDLYERVPAFLDLCASFRLYVEFTAYTGREDFDPQHWAKLGAAALKARTLPMMELVNENDQVGNHIDTDVFDPISGLLCSRGSNGSSYVATVIPPRPPMDYENIHWNLASEWQRKTGHGCMDVANGTGKPTKSGEEPRYSDNEQSIDRARGSGEAGALLCAGAGCFHSTEGKNSMPLSGNTLMAAVARCAGARSIDLAVQDLPYLRLDPGDYLRRYQKGDQIASVPF